MYLIVVSYFSDVFFFSENEKNIYHRILHYLMHAAACLSANNLFECVGFPKLPHFEQVISDETFDYNIVSLVIE